MVTKKKKKSKTFIRWQLHEKNLIRDLLSQAVITGVSCLKFTECANLLSLDNTFDVIVFIHYFKSFYWYWL